jgi:peptide deformylase
LALRKIIPYGDSLLRRQSQKIETVDDDILTLIADMKEVVKAAEGVGLAAPQVGVSKMLFLIDWANLEDGDEEIIAYINPRIIERGDITVETAEGCLSLPEVWADVQRPDEIKVEYQTVDGVLHEKDLIGMPARVFQHELDHLLGILFIDRISSSERAELKEDLQAIMSGKVKPFDGTLPPKKAKIQDTENTD